MLRGQYMNRMETDMNSVKVTYDWVIIQAGGNDLAWKNTPEAIFEGLKAVWDVPLTAGAKVMALTVTEHANSSDRMKQKLESLNSLILNYQRDGFYTADLAKAIPWTGMDESERERIWEYVFSFVVFLPFPVSDSADKPSDGCISLSCSGATQISVGILESSFTNGNANPSLRSDGVHLTKEGYELMGDTIADRLIDIIKPPGMLEPMYFAAPLRLKLESDRESKM